MNNIEQLNVNISDFDIPYPLCVIQDRYNGAYSEARFLAFNMEPYYVWELPVYAGDIDCERFWANENDDYPLDELIIGKGNTPQEALMNLINLLHKQ